jgi:hypothetical protein
MALDDVGLLGLATLFAIGANVPCFAPGSFNAASALWPTYDSGLSVFSSPCSGKRCWRRQPASAVCVPQRSSILARRQ